MDDEKNNEEEENQPENNKNKNVGERLFKYQDKYKKNKELISECLKENYSFKPEISKNTYEILRKRDLELEEIQRRIYEKEKLKAQIITRNQEAKNLKLKEQKIDEEFYELNDRNNQNNQMRIEGNSNSVNYEMEANPNKLSLNSLRDL